MNKRILNKKIGFGASIALSLFCKILMMIKGNTIPLKNQFNSKSKGTFIPNYILFDSTLKPNEKIALSMIIHLDNDKGCFASNQYFADRLGVKKKMASRIINRLVSKKRITTKITYKLGTKPDTREVDKRIIKVSKDYGIGYGTDLPYPSSTNGGEGMVHSGEVMDIKVEINNDIKVDDKPSSIFEEIFSFLKDNKDTIKLKLGEEHEKKFNTKELEKAALKMADHNFGVRYPNQRKGVITYATNWFINLIPKDPKLEKEVDQILNEFNKVCKTEFPLDDENVRQTIREKLNAGYALEDFKDVIRFKNYQLKNYSDLENSESYIRPSTFFGKKFKTYLAEAKNKRDYFSIKRIQDVTVPGNSHKLSNKDVRSLQIDREFERIVTHYNSILPRKKASENTKKAYAKDIKEMISKGMLSSAQFEKAYSGIAKKYTNATEWHYWIKHWNRLYENWTSIKSPRVMNDLFGDIVNGDSINRAEVKDLCKELNFPINKFSQISREVFTDYADRKEFSNLVFPSPEDEKHFFRTVLAHCEKFIKQKQKNKSKEHKMEYLNA